MTRKKDLKDANEEIERLRRLYGKALNEIVRLNQEKDKYEKTNKERY